MSNIGHSAARAVASKAIDVVLKNVDKNREEGVCKLIDFMQKYMSEEKLHEMTSQEKLPTVPLHPYKQADYGVLSLL